MRRTPEEMNRLARHVDLYARALGHRGAAKATGVDSGLITRLRHRLHGGPPPRRPNPGNTGRGKLSLPIARAIRAKRARGESTVDLGRRYGVRPQTIGKICAFKLYPEPTQ